MTKPDDWYLEARKVLKSELVRQGVTYPQLSVRLEGIGVYESPKAITNKLSRGSFSAVFFLQCLWSLGVTEAHIGKPPPWAQRVEGQGTGAEVASSSLISSSRRTVVGED